MISILDINAREILDSRGNPTVEVEVTLEDGSIGIASVPSGASTGTHEAVEKRDVNLARYKGKGVLGAINAIELEILPHLLGHDALNQRAIDEKLIELDGTKNKRKLGSNAILGVSLAVAHAAANAKKIPLYAYLGGAMANLLPIPLMNILNGGAHADNALDFQEFMIVPHGATSIQEAIRWGAEIYHTLKELLIEKNLSTNVGDEGGFAPNINSTKEALDLLCLAVKKSGYNLGQDISIALDVAATEFFKDGKYILRGEKNPLTSKELVQVYKDLVNNYPIISIEDGMAEDDWDGWELLTKTLGESIQIVGDDLFVTNQEYLLKGAEKYAANAILIKPNQIGTLTETWDTVRLAQDLAMSSIISHRSGETEDVTIADLAIAFGCGQIKTGAPCRTDRTSKYNRLIRIASQLGASASYPSYKLKEATD